MATETETKAKAAFDALDTDHSGFIEAAELHSLLTQLLTTPPTQEQADEILKGLDSSNDGKLSFAEFLKALSVPPQESRRVPTPPVPPPHEEDKEAQLNQQVQVFEKYLEESGLTLAFQTVFAEILSKKIEPANVFTYTAMRLRQIGKEIAHLLPKSLTGDTPSH